MKLGFESAFVWTGLNLSFWDHLNYLLLVYTCMVGITTNREVNKPIAILSDNKIPNLPNLTCRSPFFTSSIQSAVKMFKRDYVTNKNNNLKLCKSTSMTD